MLPRIRLYADNQSLCFARLTSCWRVCWDFDCHSFFLFFFVSPAAAAHGNLYNESYTAVLERTVQEIFAQTGLWFQSRNYAMGGTASGPEVAHCEDAIFGLDMDVLSWDFGMTDGRNTAIFELYFTRAGIHPNRPIGVGIETQGGGAAERLKVMQHLEDSGFPMLYLDDRVKANAIAVLPDCATGLMSEAEIAALPPYIRNFKCNGAIEKGGPHCDTSKWTNVTDYCPTRPKFRTGWHPGWYVRALRCRRPYFPPSAIGAILTETF